MRIIVLYGIGKADDDDDCLVLLRRFSLQGLRCLLEDSQHGTPPSQFLNSLI